MMRVCFTWFPIIGLGEPNIYIIRFVVQEIVKVVEVVKGKNRSGIYNIQ
jgi:hypothetical protein